MKMYFIKENDIKRELKNFKIQLKKENKKFVNWELRIIDNDIDLIVHHNNGFKSCRL